MGHKNSKRLKSMPEVTEVFEMNDSSTTTNELEPVKPDILKDSPPPTRFPIELKRVIEDVESIQRNIEDMSSSQIDLYYATLKDDLHNNWQRVYNVINANPTVKLKKIEVIERIKGLLRGLDDHALKRKRNVDEPALDSDKTSNNNSDNFKSSSEPHQT